MTVVHTRQEVETVLDMVRDNPEGFLRLTAKYCPPGRVEQVKRSIKAWGIQSREGNESSSGNRSTRRRQNRGH